MAKNKAHFLAFLILFDSLKDQRADTRIKYIINLIKNIISKKRLLLFFNMRVI